MPIDGTNQGNNGKCPELNDEDREEREREEMRLDLLNEEAIERIEDAVKGAERIGYIRTRVDVDDLRSLLAVATSNTRTPSPAVGEELTAADPISRLYATARNSGQSLGLVTVQAGDLRALVAEHRALSAMGSALPDKLIEALVEYLLPHAADPEAAELIDELSALRSHVSDGGVS